MKKVIHLFFALSMLIIIVSSCKKTGAGVNLLSNVNNFGTGAYLTLDSVINLNLSNSVATTVGIQVTQAPAGEAISSVVLFVATSATYDTLQWKKVKTVSYSGPKTTLSVTGNELATVLGVALSDLKAGSHYVFFTRVITKTGKSYDASNTADESQTGLVSGAPYNSAFSFTAYIVCPFEGPVAGKYTILRDDWADYSPGDVVTIADGPGPNEINLSQVYPNPAFGALVKDLIVDVDPATGTATIKKVNFGNYGAGYDMNAEGYGKNDNAGYVFSCTGYITLQMDFTNEVNSDFGPYTLIMQKVAGSNVDGLRSTSLTHGDAIKRKRN